MVVSESVTRFIGFWKIVVYTLFSFRLDLRVLHDLLAQSRIVDVVGHPVSVDMPNPDEVAGGCIPLAVIKDAIRQITTPSMAF